MTLAQGIALLDFSRKVLSGEMNSPQEVARGLIGLALDIVPVNDLREHLTAEAAARADAIVDNLVAIKVGR